MKRLLLGFGIVALMCLQPVMAGSSKEGGEQQAQAQSGGPEARATHGEMALASDMAAPAAAAQIDPRTPNAVTVPAVAPENTPETHSAVKKGIFSLNPLHLFGKRIMDKKATHSGGSTFGMLSLIFGVLGFVFAWFLWPLGLALALCAIIFGIIGLLGGRSGQGFAIAGLLLGLLTLLLPVLIYSWVMVL